MTYKTPVEYYVESMLRTHTYRSLPKKFLQKALVLINTKLDNPCCTDNTATIDMITAQQHAFTNTIEVLLNAMPKAGNTRSLTRTQTMLQKKIDCVDCIEGAIIR